LKVQSLNPNAFADVHVRLADVYLKENAYDKAYTQIQAYLQAEPEGRFATKIKAIMRQMESSGALRLRPLNPPSPSRVDSEGARPAQMEQEGGVD
jgi:hypothetical protein